MRGFKILIELNGNLKLVDKREYNRMISKGIVFKLIGRVNNDTQHRLTDTQIARIKILVFDNVNYLSNKSPDMFMRNFNDVIKELRA